MKFSNIKTNLYLSICLSISSHRFASSEKSHHEGISLFSLVEERNRQKNAVFIGRQAPPREIPFRWGEPPSRSEIAIWSPRRREKEERKKKKRKEQKRRNPCPLSLLYPMKLRRVAPRDGRFTVLIRQRPFA